MWKIKVPQHHHLTAQKRTSHIAHHHRQGEVEQDVFVHEKENQRRGIRHDVDDFGDGRSFQKTVSYHAHKPEYQQTPCAGSDETIVKSQHHADARRPFRDISLCNLKSVGLSKIFFPIRINRNGDNQHQNEGFQHRRRQQALYRRAEVGGHGRRSARPQHGAPPDSHGARVIPGRHRSADGRCEAVGADDVRHTQVRVEHKKSLDLYQPAAAYDAVNEPGEEGEKAEFHVW